MREVNFEVLVNISKFSVTNYESYIFTVNKQPASDFLSHTLVTPQIYHARDKRHSPTTLKQDGKHTDHIVMTLKIGGNNVTLDLTLNKQLIPEGFFHKQQKNGTYEIVQPTDQESNLCEYIGKVRDVSDSWVALSTCDGISGVIFDGNELHYIEKGNNLDSQLSHFLYSNSELRSARSFGFEKDPDNHEHFIADNIISRHKRFANKIKVLRGPYNADEESRFVELVLVMDNDVYKDHEESKDKTVNYAKSIANIVNAVYAQLNVFVALVGVVIWNEYDEIVFTSDGDRLLTNFLAYRRKLLLEHPNDNAQLITKQRLGRGVVAKSLKGPICTYEYSGGINTVLSSSVGLIATTVAHSLGHNFGMEHDREDCKCPKDHCIMSPIHGTFATDWSSCSVRSLQQAFSHGMDYCLKNKPTWLFGGPECGNGFVEPGEQCDCGPPEYCHNSCCDAKTCTMRQNATCASGECCDFETCSLKTAGTMCRSAISECDLAEYCTGYTDVCPEDFHRLDAEVCAGGKAYCYQGSCKTRDDQCKVLWGETGKSSEDECYKLNTKGSRHGNCGYNKIAQTYEKCENESIMCGLLQCKHLNDRLEFGMESVAILSHTFIQKKGKIVPCRSAIIDLGLDGIEPGLTPNGAACGLDMMCVDQKCVSISEIRSQRAACIRDCNGNGWCNNKGNCHCKEGFAPPFCDFPGPGGSIDSGPAVDPSVLWKSRLSTPSPPSSTITNESNEYLDETTTFSTTLKTSNNGTSSKDVSTGSSSPDTHLKNTSPTEDSNDELGTPTAQIDTTIHVENETLQLNNTFMNSEETTRSSNDTTNLEGTVTNPNITTSTLNDTASNSSTARSLLSPTATTKD